MKIVKFSRYSCSQGTNDAPVFVDAERIVGFKPGTVKDTGADGTKIKVNADAGETSFVVTTPLADVQATLSEIATFVEVDGAFYLDGTQPEPLQVVSFAPAQAQTLGYGDDAEVQERTLVRYADGSSRTVDMSADAFLLSLQG